MSDTKYLRKKRRLWYFVWRVPSDCKHAFKGKTTIEQSLGTDSLQKAQLLRDQLLATYRRTIAELRQGSDDSAQSLYRLYLKLYDSMSQDNLEAALEAYSGHQPGDDQELAQREAMRTLYYGHDSELSKGTLKDALKVYRELNERRLKPTTLRQAAWSTECYLGFLGVSDAPLAGLAWSDAVRFVNQSLGSHKQATVQAHIANLRSIFNVARKAELIDRDKSNPFSGHTFDRDDESEYQLFEDAFIERLFRETEQYRGAGLKAYKYLMPRLGYYTGCRLEELTSLKADQIQRDEGIVNFKILKAKTRHGKRDIVLHDAIADDLWSYAQSVPADGLLFPSLGVPLANGRTSNKYSKEFGRLKRKLGESRRDRGFHSFRVHMSTNLERAKADPTVSARLLGHTVVYTFSKYSRGQLLQTLKGEVDKIPTLSLCKPL